MEKGKIKIDKKAKVKECKDSGDKGVQVPKIFNLKEFAPQSGSTTYDCEFELDSNRNVIKLSINGKIVPKNEEEANKRSQKEEEKKQAEKFDANQKQFELENKAFKNKMQTDFAKAQFAKLPCDTKELLTDNEWQIDNFSLRLNKVARFEEDEKDFTKSKFKFFQIEEKKKGVVTKPFYQPVNNFNEKLIDIISKNAISSAKKSVRHISDLKPMRPHWRTIVGLGGESVYETGITLHHIYGIPYIPASAVKGVVRSYIINAFFGNPETGQVPSDEIETPLKNAEDRAMNNPDFYKIFGNQDQAGKLIFFDAFPTRNPKIEVDVMNPHYSEWYGSKENEIKPPTDFQNPIPIFFLTVGDTPFQFIIGSKKEALENFYIGKTETGENKTIETWLREALENHGIGAKTAVGYGRMK